jgi:uncharacterized membrane protein YkoI
MQLVPRSIRIRTRLLLALAGLPLGCAARAEAGPPHPVNKHQAKVSMEAARRTALERVPGKVKSEELEQEGGRWIYSFEIAPAGEKGKLVKEVNIDADTGKIVGVETERD